ncbi:helix-hairpin-helix domain-containing protein [Pedobacter montanisoli]|uniref:Helix-hairpin-helix domain-containing protein n=1 Tax=Pedobacter montanisoli TaxID=2923277 RepID=A0ABS9ZYU8_9SPHI|nr:helix-hairpin-helix domain-containing protein [Pedobacter montanisoli]MCJ0743496.1 helix-hairpin-helix domain-containing protein [Pedobacter montanisoli]
MRFRLLIPLLVIFSEITAKAQTTEQDIIKELIENMAENLPEDYDFSELEERLLYYRSHPVNLNHTSVEELKTLLFLSPLQIHNLFEYMKRNGKLIDIYELQAIEGFDTETVQRLMLFVSLDQNTINDRITLYNVLKYTHNDLIIRYERVLEKSRGYEVLPGNRYLGTPDKYLFRYKYNYSNRISASLIFKKDAGEYLFNGPKQYPFDYLSTHVALFKIGKFKKIVLGDYSLQFGQALTLWSGFAFGKSPEISSMVKNGMGLKPYTSSNEYAFLRGASATINLFKNIDLTPFISYRYLDATVTENSDGLKTISTINQTGLHRTSSEIKNKNSTSQLIYGGVVQYQLKNLNVGAIAYQTHFNNTFIPGTGLYRNFNFTGKDLTNLGTYYDFTYKNIYLFGEIGRSIHNGTAFINGLLVSLSSTVSAVALYRNYPENYHNFFNQALSETSEAVNEKGLYTGLKINPSKSWSFSVYTDYFRFPWLKFRVDAPSDGYELLAQANYTPRKSIKTVFRFKMKNKQLNTDKSVPFNYLEDVRTENYRTEIKWKFNKSWGFQNRLEMVRYKKGTANTEYGYLFYQDIEYSPLSSNLSANLRVAYFNTASYNSRIYAYEDDVLYHFTFTPYNGKGIRTYANLKYRLAKQLDMWARYALFNYNNVETVGSYLDEVPGNKKSDIRLQLRYQF